MCWVVGPVRSRHIDHGVQEQGGQRGSDQLDDDVARHPLPREVPAQGKGNADRRVQVGTGYLAHEQDDGHDRQRRCDHSCRAADHARKGVPHHPSTGGREYEKERPQQLREEASPLLARVVEVADSLDDALLVAGNGAEQGLFLHSCHLDHTFQVRETAGVRVASQTARRHGGGRLKPDHCEEQRTSLPPGLPKKGDEAGWTVRRCGHRHHDRGG